MLEGRRFLNTSGAGSLQRCRSGRMLGAVSSGTTPEEELLYAVARGDRAALGALYREYAGRMFSLALHMLKDRREAEDLVHDVFVEAWRHAGDYDPARGSVRAWLLLRLRSRALDRQRSPRARRVELTADPASECVAGHDYDIADHGKVRAALERLSTDQRAVLELGYFQGLSSQQIATRLGIPVGTVKSRVSAAIAHLRQTLGGPDAVDPKASPDGKVMTSQ